MMDASSLCRGSPNCSHISKRLFRLQDPRNSRPRGHWAGTSAPSIAIRNPIANTTHPRGRSGIIPPTDAPVASERYSRVVRQLGSVARRWEIQWTDVVLAGLLSVWAIVEGAGRDSLTFSPAVLLSTAPLVVRRRWPGAVLLAALAGFTIAGKASGFAALLGGLTAAVSLGLYTRHQNLAPFIVVASAGVISLEFGRGQTSTLPIPGAVLPLVLLGAAFLAGREIASRQKELNEQRQRAGLLEQEREAAVKAAAEAERRHIARELHDVVAHSVSVMVVQAGAARKVLDDKPEAARESMLSVEASGHEAMAELRRLLGVLGEDGSEAPLAPQPGLENLDTLISRVTDAGLPVELRIEGESQPLAPGVSIAAYRVVQEALTNALKYAGGAPTTVVVRYLPDAIELEVLDEGVIATPADGIGRGLVGMRERVSLFGGTVEAGRRVDRGYSVRARFPLDEPA
jgi:signal transduction histidine kinase